jgi:hypothetical protein
MKRTYSLPLLVVVLMALVALWATGRHNPTKAQTSSEKKDQQVSSNNIQNGNTRVGIQSSISITDSNWSTNTSSSDCATGQGDDTWLLTLTQPRNVTINATDCCCPGDYFEIRVDGTLIGTTPNLAPPWGCNFSGPSSSGSFTVPLCPGTHTITVRDAGFDGHSLTEIQAQSMCPAGFTVSGTLSAPSAVAVPVIGKMSSQAQTSASSNRRAQELQAQIQAVSYFVVTDQEGMQRLLSDEARRAGVKGEALALGHRIVALNNQIVMAAARGEELPLSPRDFDFIEPLFLLQAQQSSPCGDRQNPTACPPRVDSGQFFSTEAEARQHLLDQGYHQTAGYAGGGSGRDFTQVVPSQTCGTGPFRNQAIIHQQGNCWTYNTQGLEPNPEVLSYITSWPYFSWPGYVRWWHMVFC